MEASAIDDESRTSFLDVQHHRPGAENKLFLLREVVNEVSNSAKAGVMDKREIRVSRGSKT